ncbi:LEPR-XLL domain-containing protein [Salmonella enterica subsp. enterica serovar Alachua]|nr:LEPR-XLL domain-containing protein [Salmonella enterica subsp. enterica serovar Alachua]
MCRMKIDELVAAAYAAVPDLPPATAELVRDLATRLDVTFAALKESMEQRVMLSAEISVYRQGAAQ